MVLPEPVLSDNDVQVVEEVNYNISSQIWNAWTMDPNQTAVLRAVASCQARLTRGDYFDDDIVDALAQKSVCFLHSFSLEVEEVYY